MHLDQSTSEKDPFPVFSMNSLYQALKHEIYLSYHYTKSNLDASFVPFPIFTTASLVNRGAQIDEYLPAISRAKRHDIPKEVCGLMIVVDALIYGFLYTYTFDLANNATGENLEDEINKPNRPIAAKMTTSAATKNRYYISTVTWLLYSYFLGVHEWALFWACIGFVTHVLHLARYWPTKETSLALGAIAQLMVAWQFGGSEAIVAWGWVRIIIVWVFFTVAIQDFRDVPGDKACGRWTAPILFGDVPARIFCCCGLVVFGYVYLVHWVLASRYDMATVVMSMMVVALTSIVIFRVALLRTIESDRISYRWYVALYNSLLVCVCVSLETY